MSHHLQSKCTYIKLLTIYNFCLRVFYEWRSIKRYLSNTSIFCNFLEFGSKYTDFVHKLISHKTYELYYLEYKNIKNWTSNILHECHQPNPHFRFRYQILTLFVEIRLVILNLDIHLDTSLPVRRTYWIRIPNFDLITI